MIKNSRLSEGTAKAKIETKKTAEELKEEKRKRKEERDFHQIIACMAAANGNVSLLENLLKDQKIDIDFIDNSGSTLIGHAAAFGQLEVLQLLKQKGADPLKGFIPPKEVAKQCGRKGTMAFIAEWERDPLTSSKRE